MRISTRARESLVYLALCAAMVLVAGLASLLTCGCSASHRVGAAIGWRATEALTGPAIDIDLGTYESTGPLGASVPDPKVAEGLAAVEARSAAAQAALATLDAKVAAGALTPAQAEEIRRATATGEAAATAAREASAQYAVLDAKARSLEEKAGKAPSIPTDWTLGGILSSAIAAGLYLVRKSAVKNARDEAEKARVAALKSNARALVAVDARRAPQAPPSGHERGDRGPARGAEGEAVRSGPRPRGDARRDRDARRAHRPDPRDRQQAAGIAPADRPQRADGPRRPAPPLPPRPVVTCPACGSQAWVMLSTATLAPHGPMGECRPAIEYRDVVRAWVAERR